MSKTRLHSALLGATVAVCGAVWLAGTVAGGAAEQAAPRPLFPNNQVRSVLPESESKKKSDPKKIERLAPDSPLNGVADLPMFLPPTQPQQRRGTLSREQLEEIDKRKNWIFRDGKSSDHSADKMLGVREEKSFGDEEKEFKSLMQKYLEKGNAKDDSKKDRNSDGNDGKDDAEDGKTDGRASSGDSFFALPGDAARFGHKGDSSEVRTFGTKQTTETGSSIFSSGTSSLVSKPTSDFSSPGGYGRSSYLPETAIGPQKTDSQKEWAAEFKQLLEGKSSPGSTFGRSGDPANWFADPSRESINPVIGVRPDSYSRPATAPSMAPAFSLPTRATTFDSFNRTPSLSDNGTSLFGSQNLSSPGFGTQLAPPSTGIQPGGFQSLPKRKF